MSTKIEQVARSICANSFDEYVSKDPDYIIPAHKRVDGKAIATWRLYIPSAIAAIEAMQVPTDAMIKAAEEIDGPSVATVVYGMMIEAARDALPAIG